MKCRLLASFLLGFLLVMNALGDSSFLGLERNKKELEVTSSGMFAQKESFDGTGVACTRKLGLEGSKLMAHKERSMVLKNEKEAHAHGRTSKISGRRQGDALKKSMASLLEQMNDKKEHMTMLEPKTSKFTNFAIPRISFHDRNPKCYCSQYSNAEVADEGRLKSASRSAHRQISEEHPQRDETKNVDEYAKEIVNMMHKDYKGMASGKPPINNHEPRN